MTRIALIAALSLAAASPVLAESPAEKSQAEIDQTLEAAPAERAVPMSPMASFFGIDRSPRLAGQATQAPSADAEALIAAADAAEESTAR